MAKGWKPMDYTRQSMASRSASEIDREYSRLSSLVKRRVQTFEKHGSNPQHVRNIKEVLKNPNTTTRDKASAIIELKRFTNLETSTYTAFQKERRAATRVWVDLGLSRAQINNEFFEFLDWAKEFAGFKYNANAVRDAWATTTKGKLGRKNIRVQGDIEVAKQIFSSMIQNQTIRPGKNDRFGRL